MQTGRGPGEALCAAVGASSGIAGEGARPSARRAETPDVHTPLEIMYIV